MATKVGRPAGVIHFQHVSYEGNEYTVGTIMYNGNDIKFLIDRDDYNKVINRAWHVSSNDYISSGIIINGSKKELYMHNVIMNRDGFNGKGQTESVDHINRIGFDNRKENLRVISQTNQMINQTKKKRNVILPEGCELKPNDIPRHIWYVRANGLHGDRFAIEFKTEGIIWKGTSSKAITIQAKLEQAKIKLMELYEIYPYLNPSIREQEISALENSYYQIISI